MGCERIFRFFALSVTIAAGLMLSGCATHLTLQPSLESSDRAVKLNKRVGVYYSTELRNYQYVADPYGNMHSVYFPVGSASIMILDEVIAEVFENRLVIDDLHATEAEEQKLDAIIVPAIEAFAYYSRPAGGWHYWATIRYSFSLHATNGDRITRWEVSGKGTSAYGGGLDERDAWARAAEGAIQDAAARFRAGFEVIPEPIRWIRRMTIDPSQFDIEIRGNRLSMDVQDTRRVYSLDDIATVSIALRPDRDRQSVEIHQQLNSMGLLIVAIRIQNQSAEQMHLSASDIQLHTDKGPAAGPIPEDFFTAVATTYYGRLPSVSTGTQGGAIANLLFALANASALTHEAADKKVLDNKLSGELTNAVLQKEDFIHGLLFFSVLPQAVGAQMDLMVPLTMPSQAVRYRLWLPVSFSTGG